MEANIPKGELGSSEVNGLIARWESLKNDRGAWENHWQEVVDLVRPMAKDFDRQRYKGQRRTERIYDHTAVESLDLLASSLHSAMTPAQSRWFSLGLEQEELNMNEDVLAWLETTADSIYHQFKLPDANFTTSVHEFYLDLCAFGTAIMYSEWDKKSGNMVFRTFPLASCCIDENHAGQIDTVIREICMTARQAIQKFGKDTPEKIKEWSEKEPDKKCKFNHYVFPSEQTSRYRSIWLSLDCKQVVRKSGYNSMPYHVARWEKLPGEVYGRSPATKCMPTIKAVNAYEKLCLQRTQLEVSPPWLIPNDGFVVPLDVSPNGMNLYENGEGNKPEPLLTGGSWSLAEGKVDQLKEAIAKSFGVNYLELFRKKERQTAEEIMALQDERLRMLSPMTGRIQSELCGSLIRRVYNVLYDEGLVQDQPTALIGTKVQVSYISEAATAQERGKMAGAQRWLNSMLPLLQLDQSIADYIDFGALAVESAKTELVSRKIIRTSEEVEAIRQQRQQAQEAQAMMEAAPQVAGAVKDLASASKDAPGMMGVL